MADGGRWRRVRACFEALQDLPAPERDAALEQLATDEPDIADEVAEFVRASGASAGLSRVLAESLAEEPATADELAGRSLGPFQLVRQLGSGGMGVVFEAVQDAPRRRVAVKVMRHGLSSEHARKRFEVEGEILGRLKHPNVAQVFATGTYRVEGAGGDRTVPWIAMELIEGATPLDEHARAAGLSLEERLALFRALADAVQHAHARGIVHRDLKPQNALVDQEGVLKVIDFGIARMVGGDERSQLTHEGAVIGTVRYMAPEQLRGEEVDTRCDVYALGIVLPELLTGRPAHDLDDKPVPAAFRLLTEATPPAPSTVVPGLPRELDWVVRRALEPSAFDRYASAAELADDVGRFLRREPVRAHPASAAYLVRKYAARHRVGAALSGLAALFAIVALAIYLAGSASIRRQ